jgi:serine/threonine protein kinase
MIDPVSLKPTIIDFGLSELVGEIDATRRDSGSYEYVAPEKVMNRELMSYHGNEGYISGFKADVWGMGIILYAILYGQFPWNKEQRQEYIRDFETHPEIFFPTSYKVTDQANDLIQKILEVDPEKRLSIEQILAHPWLKPRRSICKFLRLSN